jgi:hypothetical protein
MAVKLPGRSNPRSGNEEADQDGKGKTLRLSWRHGVIFVLIVCLLFQQFFFAFQATTGRTRREQLIFDEKGRVNIARAGNIDDTTMPYFHPKPHNRTDDLPFHHPRNHPRGVGARFENGSYGYVVDPYLVRRTFLKLLRNSNLTTTPNSFLPMTADQYTQICDTAIGEGYGEKSLNEVRFIRPVWVVDEEEDKGPAAAPTATAGPKVLCVVYTHGGVKYRVSAIIETWGWRCDGFFAASTVTVRDPTQPGFGSVDLDHHGDESYNTMWQKTRSILAYIYEHFLDEFDYFHLCGDDVFLIPENYHRYLSALEETLGTGAQSVPMHIGTQSGQGKMQFVGGGSGYALNREALRFYNEESGLIHDCEAQTLVAAEDRYISRCFQSKNIWGLSPVHGDTGLALLQGLSPQWIVINTRKRVKPTPQEPYLMFPEDKVSNETFGWHIIERHKDTHAVAMKRYHAHFYRSCPKESMRAQSMLSDEFLQLPVSIQ